MCLFEFKCSLFSYCNLYIGNELCKFPSRIRDLSNELEASKTKLRISQEKLSRPSPHFIQLQNEMADMKVQHRLAIQQVNRRSLGQFHAMEIHFPKKFNNIFQHLNKQFHNSRLLRC